MTKRLCLFAGFSKTGRIADYVIYYLQQMARLADVYYQADNILHPDDVKKLLPYCKQAWGDFHHGKYDVGSWQLLFNRLGKEFLNQYDELILCNDSCFGPLWDLKPLFERAEQDPSWDFWGLSSQSYNYRHFLSGYFLVLRKAVFMSQTFACYIHSIEQKKNVQEIIFQYEMPLTFKLQDAGFRPKTLVAPKDRDDVYFGWKRYIRQGLPFIKVKVFTQPSSKTTPLWHYERFLHKLAPEYPAGLIGQHLKNLALQNTFRFDLFQFIGYLFSEIKRIRHRLLRVHIGKICIISIFGLKLIDTSPKTEIINTLFRGERK